MSDRVTWDQPGKRPGSDVLAQRAIEEAVRRFGPYGRFAEEMRAKGIHVGLGTPPACVICGTWPCATLSKGADGE